MMIIETLLESKKNLKTLYVSRKLLNADDLVAWAHSQGFETCLDPKEMHVTVAYSKKEVDWDEMTDSFDNVRVSSVTEKNKKNNKREIKLFGEKKDCVVLVFNSIDLTHRWEELTDEHGASWDFDDYHSHVTITYNGLPDDLNLDDIEPYEGVLEFGPEIHQEINPKWKSKTKEKKTKAKVEESFTVRELTDERLAELIQTFQSSYKQQTGSSWSDDKLLGRAQNWTFYGDVDGFVAARRQGSGMNKLVAAAGNPRGVLDGFNELISDGGPIWGAVSGDLAKMAKKKGMIVPHLIPGGPMLIKAILASVPASVFGGYKPKVSNDGGVVISYDDVGDATKYLIGNAEYFKEAIKIPAVADKIKEMPILKKAISLLGIKESQHLYLGTSTLQLERLNEGSTVFLETCSETCEKHAKRVAKMDGSEPVVVEVDASQLDDTLDFDDIEEQYSYTGDLKESIVIINRF